MKRWWKSHRHGFFAFIARPCISILMSTVRVRFVHRDRLDAIATGKLLAGLHANGLVACWAFRRKGVWTMVSQSRDGELQNKIYTSLGFKTVRGSSGRSGVRATLEAIRLLRTEPVSLIIAVDGARGPRGVVQEGALVIAKKSGAAIVPVGMSSNRRWKANSWDRFQIPKPFSQVVVAIGEPILVSVEASETEMEEARVKLEEAVLTIESVADAESGYVPEPGEKRA